MMHAGVDIAFISEFFRLFNNLKACSAIFSAGELDTCSDWASPRRHEFLAGRFCGKEAVFKALNGLSDEFEKLKLNQIEIARASCRRPTVTLHHECTKTRLINLSVSLAHKNDYVIAFAMAQEYSYEQ